MTAPQRVVVVGASSGLGRSIGLGLQNAELVSPEDIFWANPRDRCDTRRQLNTVGGLCEAL